MKLKQWRCLDKLGMTILGILIPSASFAATLITSSIDGGGGRSSAGSYVNDGCVGGIGGIAGNGAETNRQGYLGQLTELVSLSVTGTPTSINQSATSQLSGTANSTIAR